MSGTSKIFHWNRYATIRRLNLIKSKTVICAMTAPFFTIQRQNARNDEKWLYLF